jgi:hypothetical protein
MKGKQLAIILGLVVLVGGIALFLSRRHSAEWSSSATSTTDKILNFPLNDVTHVTLKGGGTELNLVKKDDLWTVRERADYPADFDKVSALLRKLWELHPVQDVKIGPSQLGRLQLGEPGGDASSSSTLIDLKGANDQRLSALLLGKTFLRNSEQLPGQSGGTSTFGTVSAYEPGRTITILRPNATTVTYTIDASSAIPSGLSTGRRVVIRTITRPGVEQSVVRKVSYSRITKKTTVQ